METKTKTKAPFSETSVLEARWVGNPQLSKDGKYAVCVIASMVSGEQAEEVMVIDTGTGKQTPIASGSSPQWNPDGSKIAFLADQNGDQAIFIYNLETGLKEFLVNIYFSDYFVDHYADSNFCWAPDGKSIAYVNAGQPRQVEKNQVVREFTDLQYKTKGGRGRQVYADSSRSNIWVISLEGQRKERPVVIDEFDEHSLSFSPDGSKVAFVSNRSGSADLNQWSDVFAADIDSGKVDKISSEKGSSFQPAWSPDGKNMAYLGITGEISTNDSPAEDTQLFLVPATGGKARCLTSSLDRRVEQISWDPSSSFIWFTAGDAGSIFLYKVCIKSGDVTKVIDKQGKVVAYAISDDGNDIICLHMDSIHLPDLFLYNREGCLIRQLTYAGEELAEKYALSLAETFWFKSFDDTNIQGWIMKPSHFNLEIKYPLILVIHGGPHNMFGYEFEDRMQLLAANGYGVLFINPRGSSGYGQEFSYGTVGAWGEGDYEDLMRGVDEAISSNSWIDPERLGVTGQSYGGYMTNRIITKTKRFKAAVADGSICNLISFAGTSLYHSLMESEFRGSVYENFQALWNCSPLKDVRKVKTPVLFLHGETDNEVPGTQADEMFVAVKKQGIDTAFVQYVGEGHGWRPDLPLASRIDLLKRMIKWFDKYLKSA